MESDLCKVFKSAWIDVEESKIPENLHLKAFEIAVQVRLRGEEFWQSVEIQNKVDTSKPGGRSSKVLTKADKLNRHSTPTTNLPTEEAVFDQVVAHTKVDREKLEKLISVNGTGSHINVAALSKSLNVADSARLISTALSVVQSAGLKIETTPIKYIREELRNLKRLDEKNFSTSLGSLENVAIKGSGRTKVLKPQPKAFDYFPQTINKLLGLEEE